jgi:hypothetical protein
VEKCGKGYRKAIENLRINLFCNKIPKKEWLQITLEMPPSRILEMDSEKTPTTSPKTEENVSPYVDRGLVSYFLSMSPEERLKSNDNAVRTILELRNAFKQQAQSKR